MTSSKQNKASDSCTASGGNKQLKHVLSTLNTTMLWLFINILSSQVTVNYEVYDALIGTAYKYLNGVISAEPCSITIC